VSAVTSQCEGSISGKLNFMHILLYNQEEKAIWGRLPSGELLLNQFRNKMRKTFK
jgi:hypothetical protein